MDTITTTADLLMSNGSARPAMVALMPSDIRLIAAAPDLLDALKAELAEIEGDIRWADDDELEQLCVRRDRISAAIAKATGGES